MEEIAILKRTSENSFADFFFPKNMPLAPNIKEIWQFCLFGSNQVQKRSQNEQKSYIMCTIFKPMFSALKHIFPNFMILKTR